MSLKTFSWVVLSLHLALVAFSVTYLSSVSIVETTELNTLSKSVSEIIADSTQTSVDTPTGEEDSVAIQEILRNINASAVDLWGNMNSSLNAHVDGAELFTIVNPPFHESKLWASALLLKPYSNPWILFAIILIAGSTTDKGRLLVLEILARTHTLSIPGIIGLNLNIGPHKNIQTIIQSAKQRISELARREAVDLNLFSKIDDLDKTLITLFSDSGISFRSTLHIPIPFVEPALMQLKEYYPNDGTCGRFFPARYGIIGRAFRTQKAVCTAELSSDRSEVASYYGMTLSEAKAAEGKSLGAIPLCDESHRVVGIYFISSETPNTLPDDKWQLLTSNIQSKAEETNLIENLAKLESRLSKSSLPQLTIYDTV